MKYSQWCSNVQNIFVFSSFFIPDTYDITCLVRLASMQYRAKINLHAWKQTHFILNRAFFHSKVQDKYNRCLNQNFWLSVVYPFICRNKNIKQFLMRRQYGLINSISRSSLELWHFISNFRNTNKIPYKQQSLCPHLLSGVSQNETETNGYPSLNPIQTSRGINAITGLRGSCPLRGFSVCEMFFFFSL